tara:strand:- start:424 stop:615 length:192 start_codon:yes stop_codon:yes gene_type:complete
MDGIIGDSTKILKPKVSEKIRIETPVGAIESDSGSHLIDGLTVVIIILVLYAGKKLVEKVING